MKRTKSLAFLACVTLIGLLVIPVSAQQAPPQAPAADVGQLALRSDGAVYLIANGVRRWVPTLIITDDELNAIPEAEPIYSGLTPTSSGAVASAPGAAAPTEAPPAVVAPAASPPPPVSAPPAPSAPSVVSAPPPASAPPPDSMPPASSMPAEASTPTPTPTSTPSDDTTIDDGLGDGDNINDNIDSTLENDNIDTGLGNDNIADNANSNDNVSDSADLSVSLDDAPDPVENGQRLTYTVSVVNDGPATATGVRLIDSLPAAVNVVSISADQGSCSRSDRTVTCELGALSSGTTAVVTIEVSPPASGSLTNTAAVVGNQGDFDTWDNNASQTTTVSGPAPTPTATATPTPTPRATAAPTPRT